MELDAAPGEALRILAADGWRAFELSSEHLVAIDQSGDPAGAIGEVRAALAELGATMPQAHARLRADVAGLDAARRAEDIAELHRHVDHCGALGVRNVVVHPGRGGGHTNEDERRAILERTVEAVRPLADRAAEAGMKIALENMEALRQEGDGTVRRFGYTAEEIVELVEAIGHPAVGVCIDTSHANLQKHRPLSPAATIRVLGRHICATHICDNDGTGDQHRTPGGGNIDWPAVMAALRDAGYDGLFNLEIPGERHALGPLRRLKSQHALRVAQWLVEL